MAGSLLQKSSLKTPTKTTTVVSAQGASVDNAPAIKAAVIAGGSVSLGPGIHVFQSTSTPMYIPPATTIYGVPGKTFIYWDTDTAGAFRQFCQPGGNQIKFEGVTIKRVADFPTVMFPMQGTDDIEFNNCVFDGGKDVYGTNFTHGVQLGLNSGTPQTRVKMLKSKWTNFDYALFQANSSTGTTTDVTVRDCIFTHNYQTDMEFNSPSSTMTNIKVLDNTFENNAHAGAGAGFGVGLAHVTSAKVTGNTFSSYGYEAIHVEDYTSDIDIHRNTFNGCGSSTVATIQVISGSTRVRIGRNTFNGTSTSGLNAISSQQGGSGTTAGGRPFIPCYYVSVQDNDFNLVGNTSGVYFENVQNGNITGNRFVNTGFVTSGVYAGPYAWAFDIYTGTAITVTDNVVFGFTYGLFSAVDTVNRLGMGTTFSNNVFRHCLMALPLMNINSITCTGNIIDTCQHSMVISYASVANRSSVITGNNAVNCANPMGIYGSVPVTSAGTATTGTGKTLTVAAIPNHLPSGSVIAFSGGGTLTTTAFAQFQATSVTGTVSSASIASGETATVYVPFSSDATKSVLLANNGDDFYGAAGYGKRVVAVSANYKIVGHESTLLITTGASNLTITVPTKYAGRRYEIVKVDSGVGSVSIVPQSGQIDGLSTVKLMQKGDARTIVTDGTNGTTTLGLQDAYLGYAETLDTAFANVAMPFAGTSWYSRVTNGFKQDATKVGIIVGTASGNIMVGVYSPSGSGINAVPSALKATSVVTTCPATGYNEISLVASCDVQEGDFLALWCDNVTATFGSSSSLGSASHKSKASYNTPGTGITTMPSTVSSSNGQCRKLYQTAV